MCPRAPLLMRYLGVIDISLFNEAAKVLAADLSNEQTHYYVASSRFQTVFSALTCFHSLNTVSFKIPHWRVTYGKYFNRDVTHLLFQGQGLSFYANGRLLSQVDIKRRDPTNLQYSSTKLSLGSAHSMGGLWSIPASFDEVAMWNKMLTQQEIKQLYDSYMSPPRDQSGW